MGMGMGAKRMFLIAMLLVVVGGLNWGVQAATGKDLVSRLIGKRAWIVYGLVALAALYIGFARDTYLPFLGESVMPCSLLKDQTPEGADTEVYVQVKPGAKVLYWATEPSTEDMKEIQDWRHAYLGFKNAGVTTADGSGHATLRVRKPQPYTVGMFNHKELSPHVHYRVCKHSGMVDRVETTYVEAFANEVRETAALNEEERKAAIAAMQAGHLQEGFEDAEMEDEESFENSQDDTEEEDEEGFVNGDGEEGEEGFTNPKSSIVDGDKVSAEFAPDYMLPRTMRNQSVEVPLYQIAEQTENARIIDIDGVDESMQPAGTELEDAYKMMPM